MSKDYYKILGVEKNATDAEIKKAFRVLAQKYHPDKPDGDEEKFKEVSEAYNILSNKEKRKQYDTFGSAGPGGAGFGDAGFGGFDFSGFQNAQGGGFEFDMGDIFGDFFGGSRRSASARKVGTDISVNLNITFKESVFGVNKTFKIKRDLKCKTCNGTGAQDKNSIKKCLKCNGYGVVEVVQQTMLGSIRRQTTCPDCGGTGEIIEKKCSDCHGTGVTRQETEIDVKIPAGVEDGMKLRMAGKGNEIKNGESGDLYINLSVTKDPNFQKDDYDLYTTMKIKITDAVLGNKKEITTVDGKKIKIKIPAGTKDGTILRVTNEGVVMKNSGRGNLYIKIKIDVPENLSSKAREIFNILKEEGY